MWKALSGKKSEPIDDSGSKASRRKDDDDSARRRSGSTGTSNSKKQPSSHSDERDRGFNPSSTSYSSTSKVAFPNTAGASVASSHATASGNGHDESYAAPVLNRNQSLADKMPKSTTSTRTVRDHDQDDDRKSKSSTKSGSPERDGKRERKSKRDKTERKSSLKDRGASRSENGIDEGTSRGPADFSAQVGSSSFQQFPGQYDGGINGAPIGQSAEHEVMSSHVQDQFPGQFPSESAEPYRPPLATSEGGPGLAAEYYGDAGQSVSEQPGFRQNSPSLIIGQEPHLLPASSVAAPPPEPSASGGVGAAASFFSGDFEADEVASSHTQATSTYTSAPSRPTMPATSSSLPALGTAAIGTAAGYVMGSHSSSQPQHDAASSAGLPSDHVSSSSQRPPSQSQGSVYSTASRPPAPSYQSSHASNVPIYAAGAAGVAGLAASAIHNSNHASLGHGSSSQQYATPTGHRHRERGPLGALVDFIKDPEGVAQFEEYSEFIGVCRHCFEPGSSPRDAPRRHRSYGRKRSDERIGRTSRVGKSRRDGSDDERRGKRDSSWLASGIAGYGLGKMGEGLFKQKNDFDDIYSVKSGRYSPEGGKRRERRTSETKSRRRSRSKDRVETGVVVNGKMRRRSRSRSRDRKSNLAGAALGAAAGASTIESSSRRRSSSLDRIPVKSKHKARDGSESERRHRSNKKKEKGFFSFGSANSSSSSLELPHSRSSKRSKSKKDDKKAEVALLGLGAAAAALAAVDSRSGHKKKGVKELVGVKETKDRYERPTAEDAGWEDEEDVLSDVGSVDSGLAFGGESDGSESRKYDRRRRSEMSGKGPLPGRKSSWDNSVPVITGAVAAGMMGSPAISPHQYEPNTRHDKGSPPLQYVDPIPISDSGRFDAGRSNRPTMVSRPEDVPFHQPQARAPVSSSVYTTQAPFPQAHPATSGPPAYPQSSYIPQTSAGDRFFGACEDGDVPRDFRLRRRDTSPARFGPDDAPNELSYRRKPSAKDDSSVVRFELPEKDEEERREKRRRRKEPGDDDFVVRELRADKEEPEREGERKSSREESKRTSDKQGDSPKDSSNKPWAFPTAVGLAGAALGAAAMAERSRDEDVPVNEETKEERRERRRRERRRDEEEEDTRRERRRRDKNRDEEDTPSKSERRRDKDREETREERHERRRREREREEEEVTTPRGSHISFGNLPERPDRTSKEEDKSVVEDAATIKEGFDHQNYQAFFTPAELLNNDDDQQNKIFGANGDADISFDQSPNFVVAVPKGVRDLSGPGDDGVARSAPKFPWQVPALRLLYPTPPSSRGSTPIIAPRDAVEDIEAPSEINTTEISPSTVARTDAPAGEHSSVSRSTHSKYVEPDSDNESDRRRRMPEKIPLSIDLEDTTRDPASEPAAYVDDYNFAATLAASAEDAGFDPSIVVDNPTYRRRESPPGSGDRHMPGGFEEEEEPRSSKTGRKKDKSRRREREQEAPDERPEDAIVKDIVTQVESTDLRKSREVTEEVGDDWANGTPKSKKPKKSKKGSKRSSTYDETPDTQGPIRQDEDDDDQPAYESPAEDARSIKASTVSSKGVDGHKKSKRSKGDKTIDDTASSVLAAAAVASAVDAGTDAKSKGKKGGSLWDRVLGKSTPNLPDSSETKEAVAEDESEAFERSNKKGKKSKPKSSQSLADDYDDRKRDDDTKDGSALDPEVSSRRTDPPAGSVAQYLAEESEPERSQEQASESFLGMRPDPPPPPDIGDQRGGYQTSTDISPNTPPGIEPRRPSEIRISDIPQSPSTITSPTAVPVRFRRPAPSSRARSTSQSPLSTARNADDLPPPSKPRPRSTEFKSSKEYRPLWLVERHQSHQEPFPDQSYPSLPSSHTTSRSSSPRFISEQDEYREEGPGMQERSLEPLEVGYELLINTESRARQSELLDSQQATPTASSFQHSSAIGEQSFPPGSRSASPTQIGDRDGKHTSSTLKKATLAAVLGGGSAYVLPKVEENAPPQEQAHGRSRELVESIGDIASHAKPNRQENEVVSVDDQDDQASSRAKKGKKGKKSKRRAVKEFDESCPPLAEAELQDVVAESDPLLEHDNGDSLTKGMPADEVVNVMTSAAQEPDIADETASKSVLGIDEEPIENSLSRTQSKSKMGKRKGKKVLVDFQDTLGENPARPIRTVGFKDPFSEPQHEPEKNIELLPMTTPVPEDNDLDLLDEPLTADFEKTEKSSTADKAVERQGIDGAKGTAQGDADSYFNLPNKKKLKKAKKALQGLLVGEGESPGQQDVDSKEDLPGRSALDRDDPGQEHQVHQGKDMTSITLPVEVAREAGDDFEGSGIKKRGKKGKKSRKSLQMEEDLEQPKANEEGPFSKSAPKDVEVFLTSQAREDQDLPSATGPPGDAQEVGDDYGGVGTTKKGKKAKKSKSISLDDEDSDKPIHPEVSEVIAPKDIAIDEPYPIRAEDVTLIIAPPTIAPDPVVEDSFESLGTTKKGKKDKKKSNVLFDEPDLAVHKEREKGLPDYEPVKSIAFQKGSHEDDPSAESDKERLSTNGPPVDKPVKSSLQKDVIFEPASKKKPYKAKKSDQVHSDRDDDDAPRAATSTSQDVQNILDASNEDNVDGRAAEPTASGDSRDQPSPNRERDEDGFREPNESVSSTSMRHGAEALGGLAAVTGTAAAVQHIFEIGDQSSASVDKHDLIAPQEIGDQPLDNPVEDNNVDLGSSKTKKNRKTSKPTENLSSEDPEAAGAFVEPTSVPEVEVAEQKKDEDEDLGRFPVKKSKKDKGKRSKKDDFTFDEPETPENVEAIPTLVEVESEPPKQEEHESFGGSPVKKSKKDKKSKKKGLSKRTSEVTADEALDEVTPDDIQAHPNEDETVGSRDIQAEKRVEVIEPSENIEPAVDVEEMEGRQKEEPENEAFAVPKSNKDKKKSKKSVTISLYDEPASAPRDGDERPAIKEPREIDPTNAETSMVDPAEISGQMSSLEEAGSIQPDEKEAFAPPKSKKDKKKGKKAKAFAWDDEATSAAESPAAAAEQPRTEEALPTTDPAKPPGIVDASDTTPIAEVFRKIEPNQVQDSVPPKSKKDKKKSKKARDFSWGAFESKDPEEEPLKDDTTSYKAVEKDFEPRIADASTVSTTESPNVNTAGLINVEEEPASQPKRSKKDKKNSKKAPAFSWDDEPTREETPDAVETPGLEHIEPSFTENTPATEPVISAIEGPRDVPDRMTFDDIIEPSEVVQPHEKQSQDDDAPLAASGGDKPRDMVEADPEEDFAPVKKEKKSKKNKKSKTLSFEPEDEKLMDRDAKVQPVEERELDSDNILVVDGHQAHALNDPGDASFKRDAADTSKLEADGEKDLSFDQPKKSKKSKKNRKSVHIAEDEPEIIEHDPFDPVESKSYNETPPPDTPLSAGSVEMLDPEEQREYNEEYRKELERQLSPLEIQPLELQDDPPLDPEEQREYNKEYRRELERQLSPPGRQATEILPADIADYADVQERIPHSTEKADDSVPEPKDLYNQHTVLEDIPEESRSKSGSLQGPPAGDDDGSASFNAAKRSKKGKSSKQGQQPVIWEDDTATAGLTDETQHMTEEEVAFPGPVDLEEPVERGPAEYRDLPSPTRGSPSAYRSPKFDNGAEDYFAMQPSRQAEEDVGRDNVSHGHLSISPQHSYTAKDDLPDWSSQPRKETSLEREVEPIIAEHRRPPRERSPSRERAPRPLSISHDGRSTSHDRSETVEGLAAAAAAAAAGIGMVATAELSKEGSKKDKKDKKSKKSKRRAHSDDEEDQAPGQDEASRGISEHSEAMRAKHKMPGQFDDIPLRSPELSAGLQHSNEEFDVRASTPQREDSKYRDSAIQIAESPIVSGPTAVHRPQHDSGYPETDASPIFNDYGYDGHRDHDIVDSYEHVTDNGADSYQDRQRLESNRRDLGKSTAEAAQGHDISPEREISKRRRQRRRSGAAYDSDDSNDSGFDVQRRRRRRQALLAEEQREPSPVSSTTKNRSSVLFDSSPSDRQILEDSLQASRNLPADDYLNENSHRRDHPESQDTSEAYPRPSREMQEPRQSIFGGPLNEEEAMSRSRSPSTNDTRGRRKLNTISEDSLENSPLYRKGKREVSDVGSSESGVKARRTSHDLAPLVTGAVAGAAVPSTEDLVRRSYQPSKDEDNRSTDKERSISRERNTSRRLSNQSNTSALVRDSEWRRQAIGSPDSIHAIIKTPDQVRSSSGQSVRSSGTPPLRRVDRSVSGDLRGASKKSEAKKRAKLAEAELAEPAIAVSSSSTYDPLTDKGKSRGDMADVYEGDGWRGQSPMSPTRPPSMRKRQSMQFADLEQRFEQLAADHRSLQNAKSTTDRRLEEQARDHSQQRQTYEEAVQEHKSYLAQKDTELSRLHEILDGFKHQVAELTAANEELQTSHGLDPDRVGDHSFEILASQHKTTTRELEDLREQHIRLADDHEDILEREIEAVRQEKDHELQQLHEELDSAKEQVRALQQQILASRATDDYIEHDEDYFETKCTALCQHVQQWVLRFSKFSDNRACRLVGELGDDTLSDLFDDAILDGTEADDYLQDRIKRRDVFMSVVMSRIFDFIFRRYLFGLDREQRKKLKDLEATLTEVGPQSAVHKWRSTTLTLLSSRPEFADQRDEDTEGVVDAIFKTLAAILPPKRELIPQITDSLRRVVAMAVDLHIEMRLQRAEFQMLPPLKPQFDPATGDLARKVPFNAQMMNERSGDTESNDQLEEEGAVISMVLFPLVVKNSDEEEQIVVCPAQVLVAKEEKRKANGKQVRVMSAQGGRSEASFAGTEDTRMAEGEMF